MSRWDVLWATGEYNGIHYHQGQGHEFVMVGEGEWALKCSRCEDPLWRKSFHEVVAVIVTYNARCLGCRS